MNKPAPVPPEVQAKADNARQLIFFIVVAAFLLNVLLFLLSGRPHKPQPPQPAPTSQQPPAPTNR